MKGVVSLGILLVGKLSGMMTIFNSVTKFIKNGMLVTKDLEAELSTGL